MGPVLGIETSCDETAAAVLDAAGHVLADAVLSQETEHAPYGGVVPEIAARAHLAFLPDQVQRVMARAGVGFADLGGVAASAGPGLIGGLIVGSQFAKGVAIARGLPYVAVNHLEAHALTARLPGLVQGGAAFPYLLLLVSGGHCQCVAVEGVGRHVRLGGTMDDAAGEAFDKVAKLLGLGWPGGPALEQLAATGDPRHHAFPRPLLGRTGCDFSFSGLKTAVAHEVARHGSGALPERVAADIAASFQRAVADVLADRAAHAMTMMRARAPDARLLVVAGGVAANETLRTALAKVADAAGFTLVAPPVRLCTDNAVMVAWTGIERLRLGLFDSLDFAPRPRWPLDALNLTGGRMNYRHAFHAGNFADCMKHATLIWLLRALMRKPTPLFVLDTHAGAGHYDLESGPAARTAEWHQGIGRLLDHPPPPLAGYVGLVQSLGLYPGSPTIIRALLREDDRLACSELHPEDHAALRRLFAHDQQVAVHHRDAWEVLRALLPPRQRRGLVLIDAPFEDPQEFDELVTGLVLGHRRFATGVFAAWYPIKHRAPPRKFITGLQESGIRDIVTAELCLREPVDPARLNGCGMLVINPPYLFEPEVTPVLTALLESFGSREAGETAVIRRIVDE